MPFSIEASVSNPMPLSRAYIREKLQHRRIVPDMEMNIGPLLDHRAHLKEAHLSVRRFATEWVSDTFPAYSPSNSVPAFAFSPASPCAVDAVIAEAMAL